MNSPILFNHEKVGLQFSGGKDSLAVSYLLRPHWDRLTFYHVDAGDLLPEVEDIVADIERQVPRFVRIASNSRAWGEANGLPSDLVPHTGTLPAKLMGATTLISSRYECCGHNLWIPMHARMLDDGITLAIRGTKRCDMAKLPAVSGDTSMGYQIWLPIEEWSHEQVFAYLREVGAPICRVYESAVNSPECATCSAWWTEGRAAYLARYHPELSAIHRRKLAAVAAEVAPVWASLQAEMADG